MPELPEVETIAADLRPHLVGRTILRCELRFPAIVRHPEPEQFVDLVAGLRIESVKRRGKYILIGLDQDRVLVVHLGMTGQLRIVDPTTPVAGHTHAIFDLDTSEGGLPPQGDAPGKAGSRRTPLGKQLRYRDPRRFGRILLGTEADLLLARVMPHLGPEPIDPDFSADALYAALRRRKAPLKAVLLDQKALAGVGNIYADESLYRARLRPDRVAQRISRASAARLRDALRESLELAIRNRGSSVDSYRDAWGERGGQQEVLQVYGRAGEPCFTCGRPLASMRIAGRTTVFCRHCQR
ncbi:MAG TPA: bifunctional DNA-formamidopyrimidine glycosylase/DNA-(apurinic or apyrimidinic site) lyase [Candidatus Dormibacteraeota bacterium]|nr:bifunctional DNA-formamidopyrimidine glycosylase/DNA-(apurinic or apyrimidinic site) lyase [Candidatus Dormibacteraeota bacterium]